MKPSNTFETSYSTKYRKNQLYKQPYHSKDHQSPRKSKIHKELSIPKINAIARKDKRHSDKRNYPKNFEILGISSVRETLTFQALEASRVQQDYDLQRRPEASLQETIRALREVQFAAGVLLRDAAARNAGRPRSRPSDGHGTVR